MIKFVTNNTEETIELGKKIGNYLRKGDVIAMQGTLAAGKTTITKGIAQSLDISETITSPTFCLISEYEGKMPLYHMDVYRLDGNTDGVGVEEYYSKGGIVIIEWAKTIKDILALGNGSLIELDRLAEEPVEILVNGKRIAYGEVVVVDENFGVRITSIVSGEDRIKTLSK